MTHFNVNILNIVCKIFTIYAFKFETFILSDILQCAMLLILLSLVNNTNIRKIMKYYLKSLLQIQQISQIIQLMNKKKLFIYVILMSFPSLVYSKPCPGLFSPDINSPIYSKRIPKKLWPAFPISNIAEVIFALDPEAKLFNTDETRAINQFRKAFNKREFNEDNRYISFNSDLFKRDFFAKVISINQNEISIEFINNDGITKGISLSKRELKSAKTNMASKELFTRMESAPEQINSFNISKTNEENHLKQQHHRPIFYEGVDEIKWMKDLARFLRHSDADPYKTHITDFALKIQDTIEFIRQGILSSNKEVTERITILADMASEAQNKIQNSKVTYYWWIHWNQRLSVLATLSAQRQKNGQNNWWHTEKNLQRLLNAPSYKTNKQLVNPTIYSMQISQLIRQFPSKMIFPSIKPIGLFAFNRINGENIIPARLSHKTHNISDETSWTPELLFIHDINHAISSFEKMNILYFRSNQTADQTAVYLRKQFHDMLMEKEKHLPKDDREKIAIAYFLLTHKTLYTNPIEEPYLTSAQSIYHVLLDNIDIFKERRNLQTILPYHINLYAEYSIKNELKKTSKTFALITRQIVQEMHKQGLFLIQQAIRQ